jgi:IgGFc binding protein
MFCWTVCSAKKEDMFYTGIMVISAFADTCVEVWAVDTVTVFNETLGENVTTVEYSYITGFFMYERYWFGMLALDRDPTGVYVNTSRPVTVISGVSCGNVPLETSFCDHMAEVVPAVSELGKVHIVPPIFGRSPQAGYVIRVVPSKLKTTVTWSIATGVVGSSVVDVGKWQEINANVSTAPMSIVCSDPCVVMQYNKG